MYSFSVVSEIKNAHKQSSRIHITYTFIPTKSLNLSKTCFMIFSPKPVSKQSLVVNAQLVELVSNCKYLGIIIDDQLKWVPHIDNIGLYNKIIKFSSIFL